ncbi:MAG TPA: hypothetical protein DCQ94_16530, partial [Nitrospira sp.]|nr:hypothetical protein [Nitrospira sp.]
REPRGGGGRPILRGSINLPERTTMMTIAHPQPLTLAIDGMSCGHCVQAVTKALSAV